MQLKRLDFTKNSFVANGKEYYFESGLSIARFREYQKLEKEAGFSMTFKSIVETLRSMYDLMNTLQFVQASVTLDNLMSGITKIQEKEPTLLKMAALFINTIDEDRTSITPERIALKIEDWAQEYDIRDFFHYALNTINGFTEIYDNAILATSQMEKKLKNQSQK